MKPGHQVATPTDIMDALTPSHLPLYAPACYSSSLSCISSVCVFTAFAVDHLVQTFSELVVGHFESKLCISLLVQVSH